MKKIIILASILFIVVAIVCLTVEIVSDKNLNDNDVIGGQTDEHKCLIGAGFSWCPSTAKCQKMWEEYCVEFKDQFKVIDFNTCLQSGNPIMESYPRQCQNFTEYIGNELEKTDLIQLQNPRPNQEITSPLVIEGKARGNWFFEGSFPVVLTNWDGLIIANGIATAQSDWMTDEFVEFKAELTFDKPIYKNNGSLILQKDNPSGLPENDDALALPILFK